MTRLLPTPSPSPSSTLVHDTLHSAWTGPVALAVCLAIIAIGAYLSRNRD